MSSTVGWNNREDQVRLYSKEGVVELSEASNIMVDDRGRPNRRKGTYLSLPGNYHSIFGSGNTGLVVRNNSIDSTLCALYIGASFPSSSLYIYTTDITTLTYGEKVSYWKYGVRTYYTNTIEKGYVEDNVSYAMPTQAIGRGTNRQYIAARVGKHIAVLDGRMLIAEQNVLWYTEKFKFNLTDHARGYIQFPSNIKLIAPVSTGAFISDQENTYYVEGFYPIRGKTQQVIVAPYPAQEYSLAHDVVDAARLGLQLPTRQRMCRVWGSKAGICVGAPGGLFINKNINNLKFTDNYQNGATLIWDGVFGIQAINTRY